MPQIAIIQPAAQAAPAPSSQSKNDTKSFSPHLDKAISSQNDSRASSDSKSAQNSKKTGQNGEPNDRVGTPANTTERFQSKNENAVDEASSIQATDAALPGENNGGIIPPDLHPQTASTNPLAIFLTNSAGNGKGSIAGQQVLGSALSSTMYSANGAELLAPSTTDLPIPPAQSQPMAQPAKDAILQQLQKIIENSSETGKVSITLTGNNLKLVTGNSSIQTTMQAAVMSGEASPPVLATIAAADITPEVAQYLAANGQEIPTEKANQNLTSTRHSIQQQYYDGKLAQQNMKEDNTSSQNNQQNNNQQNSTLIPQGPATGETTALTPGLPEQTSTFTQPLAVLQEAPKLPGSEMSRPVTLPSGTVVHQDEVVRQLIERFHIAKKDADTRINIQLHPAELGELKIDLSVKAGSIRAHVLASSQVTQEIIEKNLSKLRTILESQGFTIEEFSVASKSDTVGEFNLFDRQLFSQNDYTPSSPKNTADSGQLFNLHELTLNDAPMETSLNVTI
jgi:flagellar hook-length control protein FliK